MPEPDLSWWDSYSDQPYRIPAELKPRISSAHLREYMATAATCLGLTPAILWRYLNLKPSPAEIDVRAFVGLSVSPDVRFDGAVAEMVAELGVEELLVRVPTWELNKLDDYARYLESFSGKRFLINVLQNRDTVRDIELWRGGLRKIFGTLQTFTPYFQVGNAINRTKWGCGNSGDYLRLLDAAEEIRSEFPNIRLVGSSVIDFEPPVTLRTLFNFHHYRLDAVSALLYVNRRGSPYGRQYRFFDLLRKLKLIYAMVLSGNRNAPRLWITETNWPLLDTKPYTPNSGHPRSTVDEATQARYLKQYYQIAYQSGLVERVYWWQLINPGYGLVDHRGGRLRKHPSYFAFKEILDGDLYRTPAKDV